MAKNLNTELNKVVAKQDITAEANAQSKSARKPRTSTSKKAEAPVEETPNYVTTEFKGVEIRTHANGLRSVGPKRAFHDSRDNRRSYGAINGFVNALQDILSGVYPVCDYGVHLKYDPADFMALFNITDAGSINFELLPDDISKHAWINQLEMPEENLDRWYVINVRRGKPVLGKMVEAQLSDDLLDGRKAEDVPQPEYLNNSEAWGRFFKYEGIELALRVIAGKKKVYCKLNARRDFEPDSIERKWNQLTLSDENRSKERAQAVANGKAQRRNDYSAYNVETKPEVREFAEDVAKTVQVIIDGKPQFLTVEKLAHAKVQHMSGIFPIGGEFFLRGANSVLAAFRDAANDGLNIVVVKLAE